MTELTAYSFLLGSCVLENGRPVGAILLIVVLEMSTNFSKKYKVPKNQI